jgi:hypothetical protein
MVGGDNQSSYFLSRREGSLGLCIKADVYNKLYGKQDEDMDVDGDKEHDDAGNLDD